MKRKKAKKKHCRGRDSISKCMWARLCRRHWRGSGGAAHCRVVGNVGNFGRHFPKLGSWEHQSHEILIESPKGFHE